VHIYDNVLFLEARLEITSARVEKIAAWPPPLSNLKRAGKLRL
jgi:hypothetical protein